VIVTVGSDKGSPGATTLAVLLALFWGDERAVCELDPRGADLPYRMPGAGGRPLAASPSIATLAVDARPGMPARGLQLYAQQTALGVPVVCGEVSSRRFYRLAAHLPTIAEAAACWSGTLIADVGCLQAWNPAMVVARASQAVVVVARTDPESLGRLRDRVEELADDVGDARSPRVPVAVVVRAARGDARQAVARAEKLLGSIGSPWPVLGAVADDTAAVAALWAGQVSARTFKSPLLASARELTQRLRELCLPLQTLDDVHAVSVADDRVSAPTVAAR
jgi:hypothetical protein